MKCQDSYDLPGNGSGRNMHTVTGSYVACSHRLENKCSRILTNVGSWRLWVQFSCMSENCMIKCGDRVFFLIGKAIKKLNL